MCYVNKYFVLLLMRSDMRVLALIGYVRMRICMSVCIKHNAISRSVFMFDDRFFAIPLGPVPTFTNNNLPSFVKSFTHGQQIGLTSRQNRI